MKAIILAGGKGTRMGTITHTCPKPMLSIAGKNLIEWKINNLPEEVDEIIIVVGYLKDNIVSYFGNSYKGRKLTYVEAEPFGTGYAVWKCRDVVSDNFLVLMGDDLYSKKAIEQALKHPLSITAIHSNIARKNVLQKNIHGHFAGIDDANKSTGFINTGLYHLSKEIFEFELVKVPGTDEWGLPHTLVEVGKKFPIKVLETDVWHQVTSPDDLVIENDKLEQFVDSISTLESLEAIVKPTKRMI